MWLSQQTSRNDAVGIIARYAVKDKIFPRSARKLNIFLLRFEYQPEQREQIKIAHREWRTHKHPTKADIAYAASLNERVDGLTSAEKIATNFDLTKLEIK